MKSVLPAREHEVETGNGMLPNEKSNEWVPSREWNPFNSYKLLAHVERWKKIKRGKDIPPPVLITVDPTNICNLNCVWCNAEYIRKQRRGKLSGKLLLQLADYLPRWGEGGTAWKPGVEAICIAGGGEPLLNEATSLFIDAVIEKGVEVGIVTNGTLIDRYIDSLSHCTWVGVSVDAGSSTTFNKLKGLPPASNMFEKVIEHMRILADYSKRHNNRLGFKHPAYGISYKYLLYKENISEVYEAARIAKSIGCKNIHFRPAGTTWDKIGSKEEVLFTSEDVRTFNEQIQMAMGLSDSTFGVYGITHKFNSQFSRANYFDKCYAIFMTAVIEPPADADAPEDSMVLGLCCDRRGDRKLELRRNIQDVTDISRIWGSDEHWKMHDRIIVRQECPRCTYQPHNQIYEQVILNDSMTHKFI